MKRIDSKKHFCAKRIEMFFFILLLFSFKTNAQCPPGSVVLSTQAEVNQFLANYPNCSEIAGTLRIGVNNGTSDITDLSALINLTKVENSLNIYHNSFLLNLNGLNNITNVGALDILFNSSLTNLDGLSNLTSIRANLDIRVNHVLTDLNGLRNLKTINGRLRLLENRLLTDISGISNIDPNSITELLIVSNLQLSICNLNNFCSFIQSSKPRNITNNIANCFDEAAVLNACLPICVVTNLTTTNANNCNSNNGSVAFDLTGNCLYSLGGFYWAATQNSNVTIGNLTARDHLLFIAKKNSLGLPDLSTLQFQRFSIGANNVTVGGDIVVNCAPDITLPFSTTNFTDFVLPQFYGVCGVTNTKISKYEVIRPDGTSLVNDPFDPSVGHGLTPRREGNYQIKWTITGQNGNTTIAKTCTQTITVKKNAVYLVKPPLCNTTPLKVINCASNPIVASVNVTGLNILNSQYGLKSIKINANFPGKFTGNINLVLPNGERWQLTNGSDFPQFDGSKQNFIANFTSCYASSNPSSSENIPFVVNGTYKRTNGFSLEEINYKNLNPNGIWGLEVCSSTNESWELNCFELEFGELCPELLDYTILGGCSANDKGSVSISLSQIKGSYCDDLENDGISNYMMILENVAGVTLQQNEQLLKIEAVPGSYTLSFGRFYAQNGQALWHCRVQYNIIIPIIDNEKPQITGCYPNQTLQLGSNGRVDYSAINPTTVSDNCGLKSKGLNIRFFGGATNGNGHTIESYPNFDAGSQHQFTIIGAGWVEVEYWATDNAGNTQICKHRLTVLGDPCVIDQTKPVYSDCPPSQLVVLDNNDLAQFSVKDPVLADNCQVVKESLELFYINGTHNVNNLTYDIFNNALDPGNTFGYSVYKEGYVIFKYSAEDGSGNKGYCFTYVTTVKILTPCSNDTQAPILTNCPQDVTATLDNNGEAHIDLQDPDLYENCIIDSKSLSITCTNGATLFGLTNLNYNDFYPGQKFRYDITGSGITRLQYSVTDLSGNVGYCQTNITTIPQGSDVLFNLTPVCAAPDVKTYVPVTVNNFNKIGAFSFDLYFSNTTGIQFLGLENAGINNVQFNVLGNGNLRVSWDESNGNDIDLSPNFKLFDIVVQSDATYTVPATIVGKDLVVLSSQVNSGIVKGVEICITFVANPKGIIKSPTGNAHPDLEVNLLSGFNKISKTITGSKGNYTFDKTSIINKVTPYKNDEWRRGVDILDVARIRRHFLETLPLDSKYKILASDVNRDGKINVIDVALTNRLFLQKISEFPNNTSWRFIPASLGTNFDPLNVNISELISLDDSNIDDQNLDFISIKVGDVDHSALLRNHDNESNRSLLALGISIPDTIVNPGSNIRIPVSINGTDLFSLLSLQLNYDANLLTLKGIESDKLTGFGGGNYNDLGGQILIGWDHPQGQNLTADGDVMYLVFESKVNSGASALTMSEVNIYTKDFDKINISKSDGFINIGTTSIKEIVSTDNLRAYPNPFEGSTNILVDLPSADNFSLTVYDIFGKQVFNTNVIEKSIKHKIVLDDFPATGVYFVHIKNVSIDEVIKIVHVR